MDALLFARMKEGKRSDVISSKSDTFHHIYCFVSHAPVTVVNFRLYNMKKRATTIFDHFPWKRVFSTFAEWSNCVSIFTLLRCHSGYSNCQPANRSISLLVETKRLLNNGGINQIIAIFSFLITANSFTIHYTNKSTESESVNFYFHLFFFRWQNENRHRNRKNVEMDTLR